MDKPVVLIAEDEKNTREGLSRVFSEEGYEVLLASDGKEALSLIEGGGVDLLLADLRMPGMGGQELLRRGRRAAPSLPVIVLTAYGTMEAAVQAMKEGAYDFLSKPVNLDKLVLIARRALSRRELESENLRLRSELDERYGFEKILGETENFRSVLDSVRQIAPSRATVLVRGESGTGKELIAHAIHNLSPRRNGPFVAVHCAALPETLLESELFGHEKGAFTGAVRRRRGRFELADGGTLFLDEVAEIPPSVQVKLLRVLQELAFERVGGAETLRVDVRLIAATNQNLGAAMREGRFREDLYYRLNVVPIHIPPLRERREDIPLLVNAFVKEFSEINGKPVLPVSPVAMRRLLAYDWPGNIRELRNVVEGMVILSRGDEITGEALPEVFRPPAPTGFLFGPGVTIQEAERELVFQTLDAVGGNKTKAAKMLGMSRRTLHRKLQEYGLLGDDSGDPV